MAISIGLKVYSSILASVGFILYLIELAYLIYLAIDANAPVHDDGPALTKCPDYFNETSESDCVSLWRIATGLSFFVWFDGLLVVIVFISITFTCNPFANNNLEKLEILLLAIARTSLELVIFLFAWIEIILGIEFTTATFTFSIIGAAFIPWIIALNDFLKDWIDNTV